MSRSTSRSNSSSSGSDDENLKKEKTKGNSVSSIVSVCDFHEGIFFVGYLSDFWVLFVDVYSEG